ncbi:uncharacterized protein LOC129773863 [Toxorhynchites rutilus septentrionalis]|uniref:uncharacterized protein LOC129773863 n=1 Tax=Toxorhynchites rutilus septentrionalis TaxID=329112 RepID=UPI0024786E5E|nr:uncharacterized protein LOC129773863 [Toxorhynchites rutilus septentrionalis]
MAAEGKYVRINQCNYGTYDVSDHESDQQNAGRFVHAPSFYDDDENEEQNCDFESDHYDDTKDLDQENKMLKQQLAEMQKAIDMVSSMRKDNLVYNAEIDPAEDSWRSHRTTPSSLTGGNGPSIRWDQMKPFPKNIPANKMWEEWIKFIENVEIGASLSITNDPVPRSQLLYLYMSDDLQSIVRAAKLRPNLMKVVNKAMCTAQSNGQNFNEELQAAVNAHNAAAHTITRIPPEEIMCGRRIRRGLPLINRGKVDIDERLLDSRDAEATIFQGSSGLPSAKPCEIHPGDEVILERRTKAKGDTRFDKKRYTVIQEDNGNLILSDADGCQVRHHVTQAKKVHFWRDSNSKRPQEVAAAHRPSRDRRAPGHLTEYVHQTEDL